MFDDVLDLRRAVEARVSAIDQHFFEEMIVIRLLRCRVHQTGVRGGVPRLELADALEVSSVRDDRCERLDLFELVPFCLSLWFIENYCGHWWILSGPTSYAATRYSGNASATCAPLSCGANCALSAGISRILNQSRGVIKVGKARIGSAPARFG